MDGKRSSTDQIFEMLLKGTPSPNVIYPVGDVRDLADLHILAMEKEAADGQRFIAESEEMTMPQMARVLKEAYPDKKVSTMVIPDFVISIMAKFQVPMKVLNTMIGLKYHRDNTKARKLLGWNPRPAKTTVLDTAQYLVFLYIFYLETLATTSGKTSKVFGMTTEELGQKNVNVLFKNQGVYNGLLSVLILLAVFAFASKAAVVCLMAYIVAVALYGSFTSNPKIILMQGGLAILTLISCIF